ncbi:MAG: hypothetical protein V4649_09010 [Bacteroidota bacterium]
MRNLFYIALFTLSLGLVQSCTKYQDTVSTQDPRLTNVYCNDLEAVNYNWGFPGTPDNSVCIYPKDLFVGSFLVRDSMYVESTGLLIGVDSFILNFNAVGTSNSKITANGFCGQGNLAFTATPELIATIDTTVGDSSTLTRGQIFCDKKDTVSGSISRDFADPMLLHISFNIKRDTTRIILVGNARKL